ncbi:MAG: cyclase family protein [Saprospiraceae bacterium]|nr:cyclase family protein [Saprospiraceae bacterium]
MRKTYTFIFFSCSILLLNAQTREEGPWWPNKLWGPDDQAGASNWITPEKILEARQWITEGKVYELGHVYDQQMFVPDNRVFKLFIPSFPTYGPEGPDQIVFNDELLVATIGQVGTQFDGLGHPGRRMQMEDGSATEVFYNGFNTAEMKSPFGLQNLGVEKIKPIITSGILIDIAGSLDKEILDDAYVVSLPDVQKALARQGIRNDDITPGDAIFFNFGWWHNWNKDYVMDGKRLPSISREVVDWLIDRQPSIVGSDAILDGPVYNVHMELTMKNGIFNLEWMTFESLLEDNVYQFFFNFTPLRIKGATGSPGRPIAIR